MFKKRPLSSRHKDVFHVLPPLFGFLFTKKPLSKKLTFSNRITAAADHTQTSRYGVYAHEPYSVIIRYRFSATPALLKPIKTYSFAQHVNQSFLQNSINYLPDDSSMTLSFDS